MIKLGILGFGGIAKNLHIPQAVRSGKFEIRAAADVRPDDGEAAARGIPFYYDDYHKLLADPEIDAVLISTPHDVHLEHCTAAFAAGKHVLLEKPIARYLGESGKILEAADKAGTTFMIGFCERFDPEHQHIKKLIEEKTLGQLLSAHIDHFQDFAPAPASWWRKKDVVGGGCVIGSGVHRLDLLRWYLGEPVSVYAKGVFLPERLEAEACCQAVISFDSGAVATFYCNWAIYRYPHYEGISITGVEGTVQSGVNGLLLSTRANPTLQNLTPPQYASMYDHFADCIQNKKTPLTSGEEGYKSLRLVRAIYQSLESGKEVDPNLVTE